MKVVDQIWFYLGYFHGFLWFLTTLHVEYYFRFWWMILEHRWPERDNMVATWRESSRDKGYSHTSRGVQQFNKWKNALREKYRTAGPEEARLSFLYCRTRVINQLTIFARLTTNPESLSTNSNCRGESMHSQGSSATPITTLVDACSGHSKRTWKWHPCTSIRTIVRAL